MGDKPTTFRSLLKYMYTNKELLLIENYRNFANRHGMRMSVRKNWYGKMIIIFDTL